MRRRWLAVVAVLAVFGCPLAATAGDGAELARRLSSDRAAERGAALRDMRLLGADDADILRRLARHNDGNVRIAAVDTLTAWLRGDDPQRRKAARVAMKQLIAGNDHAAALPAGRLDAFDRGKERDAVARILQPSDPAQVFL